jgi:MFS family permease
MTLGQEIGFGQVETAVLFIATLVFLLSFIFVEQRVAHPVLDLTLFKNTEFSLGLYAAVSVFVTIGGIVIIPFYLQGVLDLRIRTVGLLMASFPIMLGVISPFSGSLSDRLGTRGIALAGLLFSSAACFGIATLDADATHVDVIVRLMLFGAGIGIFQSPNNSTIMGSVPKSQLGIASGLLATTRNVGQGAGIPILSTIFATTIAADVGEKIDVLDAPAAAIISGFQTTFFAAGIIILAAFIISVLILTVRR